MSGLVYAAQSGQLIERFGGAYATIAPDLKRPYADEYHVALKLDLPYRSVFSLDMLRRDEKNRLAAVDTGVPATAYQAVTIQEPDPVQRPIPHWCTRRIRPRWAMISTCSRIPPVCAS